MKRVHSVDDPSMLIFSNILDQLKGPEKQTLLELLLDDRQRPETKKD